VSKSSIKILSEKIEQVANAATEIQSQKKKPIKVIFDKSSSAPWEVMFSERGFLVGDTRLSFEEVKNALSKNYQIVLDGGKGLVLDGVKMQSILKYEDKF
jgi:hypothetical protein